MTATNPLPKAVHAAWCELTTPEAKAWYKAKKTQTQAIAKFTSGIVHKCFTTVQQWLKQKPEQVVAVKLEDQPTEQSPATEDLESENEEIALDQESSPKASEVDDNPTELRPPTKDTESPPEDSLEDADDLAEGEEDMYLQFWAKEKPLNEEVDMYSDSEIDSTEESANERVHA
jgi:hypothetical protein